MKAKEILEKIKAHPLYTPDKKIVLYRGADYPDIMIISEAPGKNENKIGLPFVGKAGKLLDKWLNELNIKSYGITNSVPLMPLDEKGKIRKPTKEEIEYFKFFWKSILFSKIPKGLLLLGLTALEAVVGKKNLFQLDSVKLEWEGRIMELPYIAVYHPAYYLYKHINDFTRVYEAIKTLMRKIDELPF